MSLILDALNRSENNPTAQAPNLQSLHPAVTLERDWHWLPLAALALVLCAGLLWFLLSPTVPPTAAVAVAPATVQVEPVVAVATVPVNARQVAAAATPTTARDEATASPAIAALYSSNSADAVDATTEVAVVAAAPAVEKVPTPADIDALVTLAQEAMAVLDVAEHPAPFLTELSQQLKDAIPSIFYNGHAFGAAPGDSFVTLNGQVYRDGDEVFAGLTLVEIYPDFAVLNYRGTEFRLASLSSWVNL